MNAQRERGKKGAARKLYDVEQIAQICSHGLLFYHGSSEGVEVIARIQRGHDVDLF